MKYTPPEPGADGRAPLTLVEGVASGSRRSIKGVRRVERPGERNDAKRSIDPTTSGRRPPSGVTRGRYRRLLQ